MYRAHSIGLLLLLGAVLCVASGQAPAKDRGVLSVLRAGQPISLKDTGTGYELSILTNGPEILGHKVVEVFSDSVVVEDVAGVQQARIPIYAIKSVTVVKIGGAR